ncbi:tetratricopeptide repeat protein [Pseudobacteriovorax antillogorgiicola]|uniref:Tetratricopeptide repeat-containing protein n=1 Tax=Pseudobacteriovorax antillogorgiicola TaxID=1513793 RepID=A0A1Y6C7R6_9BACT|nr:tetratricopeptide repeat protein [Pseudobacteriovorax antillogorgiicola]TCS51713.1 tetratricopeptide repeat protein [Pseudobacteriovorax antillogorgiicola]SMF49334.1 Tetratricopeptide repeat-containing protein [Pseudobacteriovorax antillogorgiicola]
MKLILLVTVMLGLSSCVTPNQDFEPPEPKPDLPPEKPEQRRPTPKSHRQSGPRAQKKAVTHLIRKSKSHLDEGRMDQAIASMERAYRIDYRDPEVSYMMARSLFAKGKENQAEQWALKSLGLWHPSQSHQKRKAWELISQCRLRRGDYKGANQAIEAARNL